MDIVQLLKMRREIETVGDFKSFLLALEEVKKDYEDWEPVTTESWIGGMFTFADGLDDSDDLTWKLVASILIHGLDQA